jgi:long-chain acyl-CoA synthetase
MNDRHEHEGEGQLGWFFWRARAAYPHKTAVIDVSQGYERRITFAALDAAMNRVANLLVSAGLKPGDRMGLGMSNRWEFFAAMFGAMRAGVVPVPMNIKQAPDVLAYILADAGAKAALIEPAVNARLAEAAKDVPIKLALGDSPAGWSDFWAATSAQPSEFQPLNITGDDPAFHPYTSGSTGRPKGMTLTHGNTTWLIEIRQKHWPARLDQRGLIAAPLYHKNAMTIAFKPKLRAGGSIVLMGGFDARAYLQALADYGVTEAGGVPTMFSLMLQQRDLIEALDFSKLEILRLGSAPAHGELMDELARVFGVPTAQGYGLTETAGGCLSPPLDGRPVPRASVGSIMPGTEVKLVGPNGGERDDIGEFWIRSPANTPGYHNLPEVTAERFVDGWLRTGDILSKDADGFFYFEGRVDDMFNCGGENVYPKEVENLLLKHPAVAQAVVLPQAHPTKGECPVAAVVLHDETVSEADLKAYTLQNGPAYAHPRRILIKDNLPLTGVNKVDLKAVGLELAELKIDGAA